MKKIISHKTTIEKLPKGEFACIKNPEGVFPEYEYVPLAKKKNELKDIRTIVCDMDGTTTTTENLCIHSLEFMVRKISDRMDLSQWHGLDEGKDYPHIIGNSTTRHVEYLIDTYRFNIDEKAIVKAFIEAAVWFFRYGKDPSRVKEVQVSCKILNCEGIENDIELTDKELVRKYKNSCQIDSKSKIVRASIDIYYRRYHEILMAVDKNEAIPMAELIHDMNIKNLIEPMPGVAIFISMIKGWLSETDVKDLTPVLKKEYAIKTGTEYDKDSDISELASYFKVQPVKLALVTSSIFYEADIVIRQVFEAVRNEIKSWPLKAEKKRELDRCFSNYHRVYDAFVTANDSHEIRLKPHRDLYSIALNTLHVALQDLDKVMGFEDSESGTIAIRAAGIPCAVALPFAETAGHDLSAASQIVQGGLPEVILEHKLFLKK